MKTPTSNAFVPVVRRVVLRTNHAERLAGFYQQVLGLIPERDPRAENETSLVHPGTGETLITLVENPTARPAPASAPGLFHTAFLYQDLNDWTKAVSRVVRTTPGLAGAADHGVSWAVYFADPEGNGIELAWDKPAEEWPWRGDRIQMTTLPLPLNSILANAANSPPNVGNFHLGHLHLQVADLEEAGAYLDKLELHITQSDYAGAVFMARGNYHHHFAINTWRTLPHAVRPRNCTGLIGWDIANTDGSVAFIDFQTSAVATGAPGPSQSMPEWKHRA
jgi:catechol 2,3-dioxygenase